jgi:hypothetical protein
MRPRTQRDLRPLRPPGRKKKIVGQFVAHTREMLESSAWRGLTTSAKKVIECLEREHLAHGGYENGRLICTYDDFAAHMDRHAIKPGILTSVGLGFVVVTEQGRAGNRASWKGRPSRYRLTYLPADGIPNDGSHEWRRVATDEEARTIVEACKSDRDRRKAQRRRERKAGGGVTPVSVGVTPTENGPGIVGLAPTTTSVGEHPRPSISCPGEPTLARGDQAGATSSSAAAVEPADAVGGPRSAPHSAVASGPPADSCGGLPEPAFFVGQPDDGSARRAGASNGVRAVSVKRIHGEQMSLFEK